MDNAMLQPVLLTQIAPKALVVLSVGVFDGVHLGHQRLLGKVVCRAKELGARAVALSFDPHPQVVLSPETQRPYLTSLEERAELIGRLGIDLFAYLRFDRSLASTGAQQFVDLVLHHLAVVELWVGPDFALGSRREGTVSVLRDLGKQKGFTVHTVPPYSLAGEKVSSTAIRRHLAAGDVRKAAALLGRCYELRGRVEAGRRIGRQLGFPTANLRYDPARMLPADGVYAAFAALDECPSDDSRAGITLSGPWEAVISIGTRPTFGEGERTVEAFLLDFSGDLYGLSLRLQFVERLRPQIKFSGPDELIEQMRRDVAVCREVLSQERCPEAWTPVL